MKGYKSYLKYQNSGMDWLPEVPLEWGPAKKISSISSLKGRLGWQGLKAEEYRNEGPHVVSSAHFNNFMIQWDECPRVSVERYQTDDNIQLAEGDLLLMKDGAAMGKLAYVDRLPGPACLNSHLLLFRPMIRDGVIAYLPKFAFYFMQTSLFQEFIKTNATGATFLGISQEAISHYQVFWPPFTDQKSIVLFLDRETGKLDLLIREQKELIALLKEKRQALISNAVTKGLNPKAKMKDSGVEWLGEVPEHWRILTARRTLLKVDQGWSPIANDQIADSDEWAVLKLSAIKNGKFFDWEHKSLFDSNNIPTDLEIRDGDVLITRANTLELVGDACIVKKSRGRLLLSDLVYRLVPDSNFLVGEFLVYFLISSVGRVQIEMDARGSNQTMVKINRGLLMNWIFPIPTIEEQHRIVSHLNESTGRIDCLINEAQESINLMHEHRASLISEAVTGKIDVRHLA